MTILVIGGAGFIGSNFLHHLVKTIISTINISKNMIEYIRDRSGHDRRYFTDTTKISSELKLSSRFSLSEGLNNTIEWYSNL